MAAAILTKQDLNALKSTLEASAESRMSQVFKEANEELIDTKIEPLVRQIVADTVGGMLSDLSDQLSEQFMVADEKLEQRFDETNIRFDRLENKIDNNLKISDRHSLEIRRIRRRSL